MTHLFQPKHCSSAINVCRRLLRLPPIPLSRMELAFLDTAPAALTAAGPQAEPAAFGAAGQRSLLRDVHSCMLRLLEVTQLRRPSVVALKLQAAPSSQRVCNSQLCGIRVEAVHEVDMHACVQDTVAWRPLQPVLT